MICKHCISKKEDFPYYIPADYSLDVIDLFSFTSMQIHLLTPVSNYPLSLFVTLLFVFSPLLSFSLFFFFTLNFL